MTQQMTALPFDAARVIQVIQTTLTRRGTGKTDDSPIRIVIQYWSLDGDLLAEVDTWEQHSKAIAQEELA